jgi:hypothetical protein
MVNHLMPGRIAIDLPFIEGKIEVSFFNVFSADEVIDQINTDFKQKRLDVPGAVKVLPDLPYFQKDLL